MHDQTVEDRILSDVLTPRPDSTMCKGEAIPEIWWEVVVRCLCFKPAHRPAMRDILDVMGFSEQLTPGLLSITKASARVKDFLMRTKATKTRRFLCLPIRPRIY
jgi:hypothetical protein